MNGRASLLDALRHTLTTGEMPDQARYVPPTTDDTLETVLRQALATRSGPAPAPTAPPPRPRRRETEQEMDRSLAAGRDRARRYAPGQPAAVTCPKSLAEALGEEEEATTDDVAVHRGVLRRGGDSPVHQPGRVSDHDRAESGPWSRRTEEDVPLPFDAGDQEPTVQTLSAEHAHLRADRPSTRPGVPSWGISPHGSEANRGTGPSTLHATVPTDGTGDISEADAIERDRREALHVQSSQEVEQILNGAPFQFICGPAGTGKTWLAKAVAAQGDGYVLAATTGIAAVNLGEGTTINALLRFYNTATLRDNYTGGYLEMMLKKLRGTGLRRILLDEVSMLDGDQLTLLCRGIDNVNQDRAEGDPDLGLILVGDFAQLPPVDGLFAFESPEWERFRAQSFRLTHVRRQADVAFIEALQAVRRGDADRALEFFRPLLCQTTDMTFDGPTLVAKNVMVDKYNQLRMDKVHGEAARFESQRWGTLRPDWGGPPKPMQDWGIPAALSLKVGAKVMVLANRNISPPNEPAEYLYINGDLGTYMGPGLTGGTANVQLDRTGDAVTVAPVTRENLIPLEPGRRKQLREEGKEDRIQGKWEVVGGITYMPLRVAYATTVHKSQGLSLTSVQINTRDGFFKTPGMLYVALSRAKTAEGLRIVGTPEGFRTRCTVSQKVVPYL